MTMTNTPIKTRFAPSPTGLLHLGNLRTALFNALFARKHGGIFLLRIEDTDAERSRDEHIQQLMLDLRWLGLDWQEGPEGREEARGGHAPYRQSQRGEIYAGFYRQLEEQGLAYPCFCSPQELAVSRKVQISSGQAPRYSGTCARLGAADIQRKRDQGLQPNLRFRVPRGEEVRFHDGVRGEQVFRTDDIGDFIIRRADGTSAFFFCNAVDDALMGVSHVLRGEDHLANTPRQILLLRALGLPIPAYNHIALIMSGDSNNPLSKREGSLSVQQLRGEGWLPLGLNNYLARLGHAYSEDKLMSLEELAEHFTLERLGRAPARFDPQQMRHWQQVAVAQAVPPDVWEWMGRDTHGLVPPALQTEFIAAVQPNVLFPADALQWARILFQDELQPDAEARAEIQAAGPAFFQAAVQALAQTGADWQQLSQQLKQATGNKGRQLFMPLRAALTGLTHGPEMARLLRLLGADKARQRLQQAGK
jgi:glutamyl-tRNA synthetase